MQATKQNQELMAEKLKNEQLQAQIQRLELASQTAQKEYELAKCQKESETSKLETLLTKTLSRVDDLEKMMKDSPAEPPKPAEKPNARPTETKQSQKARVAEPQSDSEKSASDGESDSEEEKSMVTPDGRVAIWLNWVFENIGECECASLPRMHAYMQPCSESKYVTPMHDSCSFIFFDNLHI